MPIYKMIFRRPENEGNSITVIDEYTEAVSRNEAAEIFEAHHGVRRIVAGPMKHDGPVPEGKTIWPKLS
jgi:hypothetical protein